MYTNKKQKLTNVLNLRKQIYTYTYSVFFFNLIMFTVFLEIKKISRGDSLFHIKSYESNTYI